MKHIISFLLLIAALTAGAQTTISYGDNPAAGHYITLNGVQHYYESYGEGKPMLLIHGNGTATKGWAAQIEHCSKQYKVYAIDCRGRGKSALGKDSLTYMQQAKDMTAFINALQLDSVIVVGKSDGGIIGLLMAIYYPQHLSRVVAFSANVSPDSTALYGKSVAEIASERRKADRMLAAGDTTRNWKVEQQRYRMMEFQPHISAKELQRITLPVMVMSTDHDVVKAAHTLFIYEHIPNAYLCIIPAGTHSTPRKEPNIFNQMIDRFLSAPLMDFNSRF